MGDPAANVAALSAIGGLLSALTGTYSLQKSYRFIAADQNRLIGFGSYTSTDKQARIEISAVVGSLDRGDAERVDTTSTYYYDLDEKDSGVPTALVGPMFGNFYPMKTRQLWELAPTGSTADPYRRTAISKELGLRQCPRRVHRRNRDGNPCLYTMTHRGVYRYGLTGLTYDGRGIEDLILGPTSVMNMAATKVICHLVYHPNLRQLWVWFATGSSNEADALCVLNVRTGGWARYTGTISRKRAVPSCLRIRSAGDGLQSRPLHRILDGGEPRHALHDTAVTQDAGVSYQATITTKPIEPAGTGMRGSTGDAIVLAPAASGVTLTATITPDFAAGVAKSGTALLTASALGESRVSKRLEGSSLGLAQFVQITLGDGRRRITPGASIASRFPSRARSPSATNAMGRQAEEPGDSHVTTQPAPAAMQQGNVAQMTVLRRRYAGAHQARARGPAGARRSLVDTVRNRFPGGGGARGCALGRQLS